MIVIIITGLAISYPKYRGTITGFRDLTEVTSRQNGRKHLRNHFQTTIRNGGILRSERLKLMCIIV